MLRPRTLAATFVTFVLVLVAYLFSVRGRGRETLEQQGLSDTGYAMLDERCWLNSNVVTNNAQGMTRHPMESHAGTCVVRGVPPGNGHCDRSNVVLNNPTYAERVGMENVDGRMECVVRVHPDISDSDAQAYSDSLVLDTITSSDAYTSLMKIYKQGQAVIAGLQRDLSQSQSETVAANNNWQNQIVDDAVSMRNDLAAQRDGDARAMTDSENRANADTASAVAQIQSDAVNTANQLKTDAVNTAASIEAAIDGIVAQLQAYFQSVEYQMSWMQELGKPLEKACEDKKRDQQAIEDAKCRAMPAAADEPAKACIPLKRQWAIIRGDLPNNDINADSISLPSASACMNECESRSECTHMTWSNNHCWVKKDTPYTGSGDNWSSRIRMDFMRHIV